MLISAGAMGAGKGVASPLCDGGFAVTSWQTKSVHNDRGHQTGPIETDWLTENNRKVEFWQVDIKEQVV
jgi:hypothetical protein